MIFDVDFFNNKRILLTGHTGFKGTWMSRILCDAGAEVIGYSRGSIKDPSFFELSCVKDRIHHITGDIRDIKQLIAVFEEYKPEIVIHMAAQPIVRESYNNPLYTYETNVMGTVNILECIRKTNCVKSFLNITTDKVYHNKEWMWGYRENEQLDGYDPYSNSKSCSELVTHSYYNSFFKGREISISTARAGNVIGGGDFAKDRIIPDCIRSIEHQTPIVVRNPNSTRPYQHVLEPLFAYLLIILNQWENPDLAGWYNVGPDDSDCITTGELVDLFCTVWGNGLTWESIQEKNAPHEANYLKLDCTKIKAALNWRPNWHIEDAIVQTCNWAKCYFDDKNSIPKEMDREIMLYLESIK